MNNERKNKNYAVTITEEDLLPNLDSKKSNLEKHLDNTIGDKHGIFDDDDFEYNDNF